MKFFCLLLLTLTGAITLHAQTASPKDTIIANDTAVLKKVEVESSFPGADAGWIRFLNSNLVYPPKAVRKNIQGTVLVQFIVDKTGAISDIEALSGPDLLREAAVNVIKLSPNWKPAFQNGKKVKSYKKQPITFKLERSN